MASFGKVHLLCNNAGVVDRKPAWEYELGDWEWILGVNLWGVIHGIHSFAPILLGQDEESWIVNTASAMTMSPLAGYAPYKASKSAVIALTETLERDLRQTETKVRAAVFLPGQVNTRIVESHRNRLNWHPRNVDPAAIEARYGALATAIAPSVAAEALFSGIRAGSFYIPTEPERFLPNVRARMDEILEDRRPT